jgi:Glycine zipper
MPQRISRLLLICFTAWLAAAGCASPYHTDQGALFGGVTGAGVGALVGDSLHHPLAGAAIGAGVGALTGAAVGNGMDQVEARNRAEIAARMGTAPGPGAATPNDVVAMTRAGVPEEVIINHIRYHGMAAPLQAGDLIVLQQQGVSGRVVQTMQAPPQVPGQPVMVQQPGPVLVGGYPPPPYYYGPPPYYYRPY